MKPTVRPEGAGEGALAPDAEGALVLAGLASDLLHPAAKKRTRNESKYAAREMGAGEAEGSIQSLVTGVAFPLHVRFASVARGKNRCLRARASAVARANTPHSATLTRSFSIVRRTVASRIEMDILR